MERHIFCTKLQQLDSFLLTFLSFLWTHLALLISYPHMWLAMYGYIPVNMPIFLVTFECIIFNHIPVSRYPVYTYHMVIFRIFNIFLLSDFVLAHPSKYPQVTSTPSGLIWMRFGSCHLRLEDDHVAPGTWWKDGSYRATLMI